MPKKKNPLLADESFVSAPAKKIKEEDETSPRVIARKFLLCLTKNRHDDSNRYG